MSVTKYRDASEMPRSPRSGSLVPVQQIRALWNRALLLAPPHFKRGISRFRSIEEANEARRSVVLERMRATRRATRG